MNRQGKLVVVLVSAGILCGLFGVVQTRVRAAPAPEHPHYLHALADLRDARAWILEPVGTTNISSEMNIVSDIDRAMAEIRRASIDDGKDLKDHMPIDATIKHRGRLHKAMDLLTAARKDLNYKEDDQAALGWRKAALKAIGDAEHADKQAIREAKDTMP